MRFVPRRAHAGALVAAALVATSLTLPASAGAQGSAKAIKIMVIAPEDAALSEAGMQKIAQAEVDRINDDGGINGVDIDLAYCNPGLDQNKAEACGREAVDQEVAAVVGLYDIFGVVTPQLEEAGIPSIAPVYVNPPDYGSEVTWAIDAGTASWWAGFGLTAGKTPKCKSFGWVALDVPSTRESFEYTQLGLDVVGVPFSTDAYVPPTATDFTPAVSTVADESDCMGVGAGPEAFVAIGQALEQLGLDKRLFTGQGTLSLDVIDQTGGADSTLDGTIMAGPFPVHTSAPFKQMRNDVKKYADNDSDIRMERSSEKMTWAAVDVFRQVAEAIDGEVDAAAVQEQIGKTSNIDLNGIRPPIDFTKVVALPEPFTHVFSPDVWNLVVKDGKFVNSSKKFYSPVKAMNAG